MKFDVLGVQPGPVVTPECAEGMARGVGRLLGADVAIAATGVGGPEPSEGKPDRHRLRRRHRARLDHGP